MTRFFAPLLLLVALSAGAAPAPAPPQEDPVALAALLLQDGNWSRAATVLAGVDPAAPDVDRIRYHTLLGLVQLEEGAPGKAAASFEAALAEAGTAGAPIDPQLVLQAARAWVLAEQPARALKALEAAQGAADGLASTWLVRARAHWQLDQRDPAWAALEAGGRRFPDQADFPRQQVLLLVEIGLNQEAAERAALLLARPDASAEDALTVAEAMRRSGATEPAARVLEAALLRQPGDRELSVRAAAVSMDLGRPRTAARFLQVAAETDPTLCLEAAELFRRAGDLQSALYLNSRVLDPVEKVRQRFGLLLDGQDFERAVALEERLSRLGLLQDDNVRYGLAYAWFRVGDLDASERLLGGVQDAQVFTVATALREAIGRCRESAGGCL